MKIQKILLAILAMGLTGFSIVMTKIGIENFPPIFFNLLRFLFISPALLFVPRPKISWGLLSGIGLCLGVAHISLINVGFSLGSSAGSAVLLLQTGGLFAIVFSFLFFKHKPSRFDVLGLIVGFLGIYWISADKGFSGNYMGSFSLLISAAAWGLGYTFVKKAQTSSFSLSVWMSVIAIPVLSLASLLFEKSETIYQSITSASLVHWGTIIYISWGGMIGAISILMYLMRTEQVSKVAPFNSLMPLFGCIFSFLILGETISASTILGGLLIVSAVFIAQFGNQIMKLIRPMKSTSLCCLFLFGSYFSELNGASSSVDVAIIGGGCAGLSSAMVASEYGYNTVVYAGPQKGGALNVKTIVGNWPGKKTCYGNEIIKDLEKQAVQFGALIESSSIVACDFSKYPFELQTNEGKTVKALSVIIATGTRDATLDVPGYSEYLHKGIWDNNDVYEKLDAFNRAAKNQNVLVIGSGVDAMKKSAYSSIAHAKKVWIAARGSELKISHVRKRLMSPFTQIEILPNTKVIGFEGNGKTLQTALLETPQGVERKNVEMAIVSAGRVPNSELFSSWIETDTEGRIFLHQDSQSTNLDGIFAAGDVTITQKKGQGAIAASEGMKAGYEAVAFLKKNL